MCALRFESVFRYGFSNSMAEMIPVSRKSFDFHCCESNGAGLAGDGGGGDGSPAVQLEQAAVAVAVVVLRSNCSLHCLPAFGGRIPAVIAHAEPGDDDDGGDGMGRLPMG